MWRKSLVCVFVSRAHANEISVLFRAALVGVAAIGLRIGSEHGSDLLISLASQPPNIQSPSSPL